MTATTVTTGNPRPGMIAGLVAWWRNTRAARAQLGELQDCAGELGPKSNPHTRPPPGIGGCREDWQRLGRRYWR